MGVHMTELKIIQAENGFIIENEHELDDGIKITARELFEDGKHEVKCLQRMLLNVAERIYPYDPFSNTNVNIIVKFNRKGDEVVKG